MAKAPKTMKAALKQVEKSKKDERRDKTQGFPEGSKRDIASDKKDALQRMKKGKK